MAECPTVVAKERNPLSLKTTNKQNKHNNNKTNMTLLLVTGYKTRCEYFFWLKSTGHLSPSNKQTVKQTNEQEQQHTQKE